MSYSVMCYCGSFHMAKPQSEDHLAFKLINLQMTLVALKRTSELRWRTKWNGGNESDDDLSLMLSLSMAHSVFD